MIQVSGLEMAYNGRPLFSQATFSIQQGEKCGLVGRNGSGKSTIFRLLTKEEAPDGGEITVKKNYKIGFLNQHIRFKQDLILDEAAEGLPEGEKDCLYKAEIILFGLGFNEEDLYRPISDFSGGYQLRLHLAKVLISEPDCLLLDEPTNYLDIVSIRWLTRFLQDWKREFVIISHDREFMDSVTTHTMGIHREKVRKFKGDTVAFYEQMMLEEEIHHKTRENMEKKRAHLQSFIDRFGAKASKATQAQSKQKMLDRIPVLEQLKAMHNLDFKFKESFFPGKKMMELDQIDFAYDAENPLIKQFSLTLEKGDRVAIIGKNGRGKSTLLRLIAKGLEPDRGIIKHSENLAIGYFGQTNIDRLHPNHTIEEEVSLANPSLNRTEVKNICGLMMFSGDQSTKTCSVLSGGEKSRVLLGKILAKPCNLLLLDEPTHHLDMESIEALTDALEEFEGAVVLVTHSELMLKRLPFDKLVVCRHSGQEVFLGNYVEFLEKDGWHDGQEEAPKPAPIVKVSQPSPLKAQKPREKEIKKKEESILKLEQEQQALNETLMKMVHDKDVAGIKEKTNHLENIQRQIEALYHELAQLEGG